MINSDATMAVAFFGAIAVFVSAAAFAWAKWLAHRYDGKLPAGGPSATDAARLERVEEGLEALTLEMERLAEGQRYTARLLEERLPRTLPAGARPPEAASGGVVTPH